MEPLAVEVAGFVAPEPPVVELPSELTTILAESAPDPETAVCSELTLGEKVAALTATSCRWPCGDPQHPGFHFCGSPVTAPPYCEEHRGVAYLPSPVRWVRRRRRSTRGIAYTSARGIAWAG
jgi:hypothetical protein